jgi:hypothetical protein
MQQPPARASETIKKLTGITLLPGRQSEINFCTAHAMITPSNNTVQITNYI